MSKKLNKSVTCIAVQSKKSCAYCSFSMNSNVDLGEKFRTRDLVVHYYCLLLSKHTQQKGQDNEGVMGFLYQDIKQELTASQERLCSFCNNPGASTRCEVCLIYYHLPCGLLNNCMPQFSGDYPTFCCKHRPRQEIPEKIRLEAKSSDPVCCICFESVDVEDKFQTLWSPCCQKYWYHALCVKTLSLSEACLFKCPFCSDVDTFKQWMIRFGVFVPHRDASWELEPGAFNVLYERYRRCDAEACICPHGRDKSRNDNKWKIAICMYCGSQGTHYRCSDLTPSNAKQWNCARCVVQAQQTESERPNIQQ